VPQRGEYGYGARVELTAVCVRPARRVSASTNRVRVCGVEGVRAAGRSEVGTQWCGSDVELARGLGVSA